MPHDPLFPMNLLRWPLASLVSVTLAACGGGSGAPAPATSASGPAASTPASPVGIERFGVDNDKNGVPDRLDSFVDDMKAPAATKESARRHYRLISRLAADALNETPISEADKQRVFASLSCYTATVADEKGVEVSLEDQLRLTREGYKGLHALNRALNGTLGVVYFVKDEACSAAQ